VRQRDEELKEASGSLLRADREIRKTRGRDKEIEKGHVL